MLVDHADAGADRVLRRGDGDGPAVDAYGAAVRPVVAVDDPHQRRLAGAVLAHDAVDRAFGDGKVDRAVGVHVPEALVDAGKGEGGHAFHRV